MLPVLTHSKPLIFGRSRRVAARPRVDADVPALWIETSCVLAQYSTGILFFAFIAFSLPVLAGSIAASIMTWQNTGLQIGPSWGARPAYSPAFLAWQWKYGVQAALSIVLIPFARGVISWLALNYQNTQASVSTMRACIESLRRLPVLLFTVLLYGSVTAVGAIGMMMLFRELHLDLSNISLTRILASPQQLLRGMGVRMLDNLIPNPGSPFSDGLGWMRMELRRSSVINTYSATATDLGDVSATTWLIGGLAALTLLFGESFFRMRINAVMSAAHPHLLTGFVESFRLGSLYFGKLTLHITTLRLAQFVTTALFITLPLILIQAYLAPHVFSYFGSNFPTNTVIMFALDALASPVLMMFIAFVSVYDARLYLRLTQPPVK